jgi:hypothetical protein
MSAEEKNELIGRVVTERNELQKELKFIDVALERCALEMASLSDAILRRVRGGLDDRLIPISEHLREHAGLEKLDDLLVKQQSLSTRLRACKQQAFNLGIE